MNAPVTILFRRTRLSRCAAAALMIRAVPAVEHAIKLPSALAALAPK